MSPNVTMSSEANEMEAEENSFFPLPKMAEFLAGWFLMSTVFLVGHFQGEIVPERHIWVKKPSTGSKDLWTSRWSPFSFFNSKNWGFIICVNWGVGSDLNPSTAEFLANVSSFLSACQGSAFLRQAPPPLQVQVDCRWRGALECSSPGDFSSSSS